MRPLTVIAIVALIAVPVITFYDLNGNSFDVTDRQVVLVVSDSMDGDVHDFAIDSFPADTLVMIRNIPENETRFLHIGDVVSYFENGERVQKRIAYLNEDTVQLYSDNGRQVSEILYSDIEGEVVGTNAFVGKVVASILDNFLVFLFVAFVLTCVIIVQVMRPFGDAKEGPL